MVQGLIDAAERLAERFKGCEGAVADVHEAHSLTRYLSDANCSFDIQLERCIWTFLFILRVGCDSTIPAPKALHDFSHLLLSGGDLFPGIDEDEDVWQALEDLWRNFNRGRVCARSSYLYWCMQVCRPCKSYPTPPPLRFDSQDNYDELPCGWGCGGKCVEQSSTNSCVTHFRGWCTANQLSYERNLVCSCEEKETGCWNLFDLVERLAQQDCFFAHPVYNLGWNLRMCMEDEGEVIDEVYSEVRARRPIYNEMEDPGLNPFRVREAKQLLRGISSSAFLQKLLLYPLPKSALPLYHSLLAATTHARLWLLRAHLPVHLGHTLTYADICTANESQDACNVLLEERGSSILEQLLRSNTLGCFWGPRVAHEFTGISVGTMRPEDYNVPEKLVKENVKLWNALVKLPLPVFVSHDVQCSPYGKNLVEALGYKYLVCLEKETKDKVNWLFGGANLKPEFILRDVLNSISEVVHPRHAAIKGATQGVHADTSNPLKHALAQVVPHTPTQRAYGDPSNLMAPLTGAPLNLAKFQTKNTSTTSTTSVQHMIRFWENSSSKGSAKSEAARDLEHFGRRRGA